MCKWSKELDYKGGAKSLCRPNGGNDRKKTKQKWSQRDNAKPIQSLGKGNRPQNPRRQQHMNKRTGHNCVEKKRRRGEEREEERGEMGRRIRNT